MTISAAQMLESAQSAYQQALQARSVWLQNPDSARRVEQHDIDALLRQVQYWERKAALENGLSRGGIKSIQVVV